MTKASRLVSLLLLMLGAPSFGGCTWDCTPDGRMAEWADPELFETFPAEGEYANGTYRVNWNSKGDGEEQDGIGYKMALVRASDANPSHHLVVSLHGQTTFFVSTNGGHVPDDAMSRDLLSRLIDALELEAHPPAELIFSDVNGC